MVHSLELAIAHDPSLLAPNTSRAALMRAQMTAEIEIRSLLKEYIAQAMVENVDYGVIPGTKKPTLLKPGAEKLVDLFRVEPSFDVTARVEDWDRGLFHYEIKCELRERESKTLLAVGLGSANSKEGRYRWRNGERVCPACGKPTIIKGKAEYGGGFICFAKKGGCGTKFDDRAPEIVDQPTGKVENDDIYTLVNTILKMAKKRALVDGAIALARCSDIFTQDVEDLADHLPEEPKPRKTAAAANTKTDAATQGTAQAPKQQAPAGPPSFSTKAKWAHAEQWKGKPLVDAPLDTLIEYGTAVQIAIDKPDNKSFAGALKKHLADVEQEIERKEPPATTPRVDTAAADAIGDRLNEQRGRHGQGDENDDWGLASPQ